MKSEKIIVANWKMNPERSQEAISLFRRVQEELKGLRGIHTVICPPFLYLSFFESVKNARFSLGGQNCFWEKRGAATGEISPTMLKNMGCRYVILGHSERRLYLTETIEMVRKKTQAALKAGLQPILCVENPVQLKDILRSIGEQEKKKMIVVYEPSFAISTSPQGHAASVQQVKKRIESLRKHLPSETLVLYGGSVNVGNILAFLKEGNAQGVLVGQASLKPKEFVALAKKAALV